MKKYAIYANRDPKSTRIAKTIRNDCRLMYDESDPDYLVIIGGDGTVLKAVMSYEAKLDKVVFFAINSGHLGYYTNYTAEEITEMLNQMHQETFLVEKHILLHYRFYSKGEVHQGYAMNEVTLINSPKVLVLDLFIDDFFLEKLRGTGLCISTPTGSSAYNKSLGGAVVDYDLPSLQIAEIASINSNAYRTLGSPLIVSALRKITILPNMHNECIFTCDNLAINCDDFERLEVELASKYANFACCEVTHFLQRVKKGFL